MDDDDRNNKEEEEYYTTTFTKILQQKKKYPALHYIHANIMNRNNSNCSSLVFAGGQNNYNYHHPNNSKNKVQQEYTSGRRQLGIRMIQQRWQSRGGRTLTTTMNKSPKNKNRMIGWSNTADNDALFDCEKDDDDEDAVIFCHNDKRQRRGRSAHDDDDFSDFSDESSSSPSPYNYNNNAATLSIQPTLLFRRTHANLSYYSSTTRHYTNIQFLNNPSVVIGVDNYGDLDVVRVPLSSCSSFGSGNGGGFNDGDGTSSNDDEEDGGGGGIGTLQADRMPISNEMIHRHNNNNSNNNNGGPRQPMDNFHYEVYGYDNGTKFAVGLRSGRVQLFTTERAAAAAAASDRGATTTTSSSSSSLASTNALWSCLPSTITTTTTTIGPRRRYRAHDKYPLSIMMLSNTTTTTTNNKSNLFDAYNTSFLEEISDWDKDDLLHANHHLRGDGYPWAFRDGGGGLSGTALMGACVDVENGDCFSLRVIDERCCQQSNNGNDSSSSLLSAGTPAMLNVVVVDDRSSKRRFNSATTERVDSVCFSGEYGLVTSHSITRKKNDIDSRLTATSIKVSSIVALSFWDEKWLVSFFCACCTSLC